MGRYEHGLFVCPSGLHEEDAAGTPTTMFGFQVPEDHADTLELDSVADYSDRRKCYAAKKISVASNVVSTGIGKGAKMFGKGMGRASGFVKTKLKKSERDDAKYDKTKAAVKVAKGVTSSSLAVVGALTDAVVSAP